MTGGCSSPAKSEGMTPKALTVEKAYPYSVRIKVAGGRPTHGATEASQISNEAFAQAVTTTIAQNKLFSQVIQGERADYLLNVDILSVEQPALGLNMTVRMEAAWELVKADTGKPVLRESIVSSYTATVGDAFAAVTRCRLATEGAARKNIEEGLTKISRLAL
jgi:hypothetical protein